MGSMKYSLELRIAVVKHSLSKREQIRRTAEAFGVHESAVRQWVAAYQKQGVDGITSKNGRYSFAFKLNAVRPVQREFLSFREAAIQFNISENKVVSRWIKVYEASGGEGLRNLQKGGKNAVKKINKEIPPRDSSSKPVEVFSDEAFLSELR